MEVREEDESEEEEEDNRVFLGNLDAAIEDGHDKHEIRKYRFYQVLGV